MTTLASAHLIIAPVIIPIVSAALLLFVNDKKRLLRAFLTSLTVLALLVVAVVLLFAAHSGEGQAAVYLLGNWPPPFAIVLVLDRLSAMMLVLTAVLAIPALLYSFARWHRAGPHFYSLFLLLLMGINGAFLTGDLFNLFVFFEVMLAASYGLALHASGPVRVRAGLHYIAVNLAASLLFLIGVSMIYGASGTLNMADLAARIPALAGNERMMTEVGAAILGVAFLVKAGMWPLSFWLPATYAAAAAPVAAMFAILSKVGVYVLLRLSLLFFGDDSGDSAGFGSQVLLLGGMATIAFGLIGVLSSQALGQIAGYSVLVSSGTLLAAFGFASVDVTAGALYYLVSSTLAISAFFLIIELVERGQTAAASILAVTREAFGDGEEEEEEEGVAFPGTLAVLGIAFGICVLLLAGLPPLSGFIAKFLILLALINPSGLGEGGEIATSGWWLAALLILAGLATLISLTRSGIGIFWAPLEAPNPRVRVIEFAAVVLLLAMTFTLVVQAGPVMQFMDATAQSLHSPQLYVESVLQAPRVTSPQGGVEP